MNVLCSFKCVRRRLFFPSHESASESELKAAKGHNLTIGTAQVDTYDKVKCIIEAVSI